MIFGSICSGIEAASAAWHPLGWRASFVSETEAFPRAVLEQRWGAGTANGPALHGDFTTIEAGQYEPIDLLVGGTPCQSFSVAGLRGGLDDDRGNLALEFLRLADRLRPRWLLWENVPGVLSSNGGRDFGAILGGMVELGYGFAYRVLDAQYVRVDGLERAVPQRRRRVFVVGYLGDWRRAAAVLFERESLSGDPAPRRETGQGAARPLAAGTPGSSGYRNDADTADNLIPFDTTQITSAGNFSRPVGGDPCHPLAAGAHAPAVAHPLTSSYAKHGGAAGGKDSMPHNMVAYGGNNTAGPIDAATALNAHGGPNGRQDFESETFVIQERAVSENPDAGPDGKGVQAGIAYTLEGRPNMQAVAFKASHYTRDKDGAPAAVTPPLSADADRGDQDTVVAYAFEPRARGDDGRGYDRPPNVMEGVAPSVNTVKQPCVAFSCKDHGADAGETAPTLRAMGHADSHENGGGQVAVAHVVNGNSTPETMAECAFPLRADDGSGNRQVFADCFAVRRLTPTECERLQGFPDGYTNVEYRGKPAADGPRYKALGNSMAVNVMRWIGRRIQMVETLP